MFLILPSIPQALATTLSVGAGQQYSTISGCIAASFNGDICDVRAGTFKENVSFGTKQITVRGRAGETVTIVGSVNLGSASNAVLEGLVVQAPSSGNGISASGGSGTTIRNNVVSGARTGYGIYTRNSTKITVEGNEVYGNFTGIGFISCHSTNSSYDTGCLINGNYVHDNSEDGIEGNGEYVTIVGNTIANNIDANYLNNHPDGIQFLAGCADGFCAGRYWRIYNNTIRNHTQNIFIEGINSGEASDAADISIWNNVLYMSSGTVNGVNMDSIYVSNVVLKFCNGCQVYNNYLGRAGNLDILVQNSRNGTIIIKNNVIANNLRYGISVEDSADLPGGGLDYNFYATADSPLVLAGKFYATLTQFKSAVSAQEVHGVSGNPMTNAVPNPQPQAGSPLIATGTALAPLFQADRDGVLRPPSYWDIGPYQANTQTVAPPTGLSYLVR